MAQSTERLGWLGTGRMGSAMAGRLITAGERVVLWNRTKAKTAPLVDMGATAVETIHELAECDVVFVMVTTPTDLVEVIMGASGLLSAPSLPRVIVDCSTVSGEASSLVRAAAAAKGVDFIGAPISGNPTVVESGGASMVASGPAPAFELVRPYLLEIANVAVFAGEEEQSRLVKLATNLYLGVMVQALAEVTTLVEKGGTDRAAFLEFLNGTVMGSDWVRRRTPDLIKLDWTPIFPHELMRKDFDLGLGTARDLEVPMPVVSMVHQLLQTAIGRGLAGQDFLSLYVQQAEVAGLQPKPG
jgi:3-hydroxyisobutyrate dehydrogenase-like beta-hydroxyacid dehydrogenase